MSGIVFNRQRCDYTFISKRTFRLHCIIIQKSRCIRCNQNLYIEDPSSISHTHTPRIDATKSILAIINGSLKKFHRDVVLDEIRPRKSPANLVAAEQSEPCEKRDLIHRRRYGTVDHNFRTYLQRTTER